MPPRVSSHLTTRISGPPQSGPLDRLVSREFDCNITSLICTSECMSYAALLILYFFLALAASSLRITPLFPSESSFANERAVKPLPDFASMSAPLSSRT
jgi:hypothetical protein